MQWHDLLFMHWPVAPAALRPYIPPALTLETFAGSAWLGIILPHGRDAAAPCPTAVVAPAGRGRHRMQHHGRPAAAHTTETHRKRSAVGQGRQLARERPNGRQPPTMHAAAALAQELFLRASMDCEKQRLGQSLYYTFGLAMGALCCRSGSLRHRWALPGLRRDDSCSSSRYDGHAAARCLSSRFQ
jgi:hypothetical protein